MKLLLNSNPCLERSILSCSLGQWAVKDRSGNNWSNTWLGWPLGNQSWSPSLLKDIACLEQIQRRATKLVDSLSKVSYSERLNTLGLTTLETRPLRGDLTETYKLLTHKERINPNQFFSLSDSGYALRGHSLKLFKPSVRLNVRKHFYSYRVIDFWNQLPQHVVEAPTVNCFKNRLEKYWKRKSQQSKLHSDVDTDI